MLMILVFDPDGATFERLRGLHIGPPIWRVDRARKASLPRDVQLAIVATSGPVSWSTLPRSVDILVVTDRYDEAEAGEAFARGLVGYLDSTLDADSLRRAIRGALVGEPAYSRHVFGNWLRTVRSRADIEAAMSDLTPREREVLALVAQGLADKEIAQALGVTTATAQKHVSNILERLRVPNRAAAAVAGSSVLPYSILARPV